MNAISTCISNKNIRVISDLKEICELKEQWNAVSGERPFLSWEWFNSWYQNYSHGNEPFVFVEQTAGQPIEVIAPFYKTCSRFGAKKLCFAADEKVCTDYTQFITSKEKHAYFVSKFACWLKYDNGEKHVDFIEFDGLEANAQTTQELVSQLHDQGFFLRVEPQANSWTVDLNESWEDLNTSFSKKHRRKTKKAVERLSDSIVHDSTSREVEYLWSNFVRLHQLRRRAVGSSGCFADKRFERFLKSATAGLLERGLAEILVLEHQKKIVAATLVFNNNSTAYMYQTGFIPGVSHLEPGYMLVVAAMQWAIDRELTSFDFMRGDEPYKTRWNTQPNPLVRVQFQLSNNFRSRIESRFQQSKLFVKSSLGYLGL